MKETAEGGSSRRQKRESRKKKGRGGGAYPSVVPWRPVSLSATSHTVEKWPHPSLRNTE